MGIAQHDDTVDQRLFLHPSVGVSVDPTNMTPAQKVAAVAKVRCLEYDLFGTSRRRADRGRASADEAVARINQLRRALGWLEIDGEGSLRWPHLAEAAR